MKKKKKLYLSEYKIYLQQWYMLKDHSQETKYMVLAFCIKSYYCSLQVKSARILIAQLSDGKIKYLERGIGTGKIQLKLFRRVDETEVAAHSL